MTIIVSFGFLMGGKKKGRWTPLNLKRPSRLRQLGVRFKGKRGNVKAIDGRDPDAGTHVSSGQKVKKKEKKKGNFSHPNQI